MSDERAELRVLAVEDQEAFRQDLAALRGDAQDFERVMQEWFGVRFVTVHTPTNRQLVRAAGGRARLSTWIKSHKPRVGHAGRLGHTCKTCRKG